MNHKNEKSIIGTLITFDAWFPSYKVVLDEIQKGLAETDNVFFIGEEETLEDFYTLYIFIEKANGAIVHHKFYREFYWRQDKQKDAVPYEETCMDANDFKNKHFRI